MIVLMTTITTMAMATTNCFTSCTCARGKITMQDQDDPILFQSVPLPGHPLNLGVVDQTSLEVFMVRFGKVPMLVKWTWKSFLHLPGKK